MHHNKHSRIIQQCDAQADEPQYINNHNLDQPKGNKPKLVNLLSREQGNNKQEKELLF